MGSILNLRTAYRLTKKRHMSNKYPRIAGRMTDDAIDLRRAVADLTNAIAVARKDGSDDASHHRVWLLAGEVERLATCIRADAMSVTEAVPQAALMGR